MTVDELEQQVMKALLAGDDPLMETLRKQYASAVVRDGEVSAGGFVTRFEIPEGVPLIDRKLLHLDDLQIELEGLEAPADTSLHVHNGRLRSLECFVYDGVLPEAPVIRAAWFYGTERYPGITPELLAQRDLEELLEEEE